MKLITKSVRNRTPLLGATSSVHDPTCQFKLFTPSSSWTWYIIELAKDEDIAFCFAVDSQRPDCAELGNVSLVELAGVKLPLGLSVERDIHWKPRPLSEVMADHGRGMKLYSI